jgi:NAD(P)-dependent dehydrogenase (short-subunit alcohol dehydrogenase family)
MSRFEGKVAFITGGASGIGFATAKLLVEEGAKVVIGDINTSLVEKSAADLGGSTIGVELDVSDPNSVESATKAVEEKFGGLDLAVNAAGIMGKIGSITETDPQETWRVLAVNLAGVIYSMKYEILAMKKRTGKGQKSAIVNIASVAGMRPHPFLGHYSSTKAGVIAITKVAAVESGPDGIRVNSIAPGHTETPLVPKELDREFIAGLLPTRRMGTARDIAEATAFLLSSAADQITGINVPVDGGYMADNPVPVPGH